MAERKDTSIQSEQYIPPWRDGRIIGIFAQIAFLVALGAALFWLFSNIAANLDELGPGQFICRSGSDQQSSLRCAFDFLSSEAQFEIAEAVIEYETSDSYWSAIAVGALNTIKVAFVGIFLATLLGTVTGIARLSENWLLRNIAKGYVDIMRNTPLLLQLFFLYYVVLLAEFPPVAEAISVFNLPIFISQRGINYPEVVRMSSFSIWVAFMVGGLIQAQVLWLILRQSEQVSGREYPKLQWAILSFLVVVGIGWFVAGSTSHNESILVSRPLRIREIGDVAGLMERRLNIGNIEFLEDSLAQGEVTEEMVEENALRVCALQDSASEVNLTAQLRSYNIPYTVKRYNRADEAIEGFAGDVPVCEVFVASTAVLAAEREQLEDSQRYLVVPIDETPARLSIPRLEGFNFVGGTKLSLEYTGMLVGLVVYTAAFIAEIVRAGIMSVGKGQSEAARALGLSESQRLRLIVLPQALRVIIPPMTSQYLNLTKNSSLALAIGYPDLWQVMNTIINQSGRSIQPMVLTGGIYLTFSLLISLFLNWYNRKIALVER